MPIYEYQCSQCGKRFEKFQKISESALRECKFCGGSLNKLISNCGFQLKGTGWYVTDYKKPVDSASATHSRGNSKKEAEKTEVKTDDSAATTSTESKSETKTTESTKPSN